MLRSRWPDAFVDQEGGGGGRASAGGAMWGWVVVETILRKRGRHEEGVVEEGVWVGEQVESERMAGKAVW